MANSKYTTVTRTPSGSGRVRSTWELSDINTGLNIPANATIDKATVTVYFKETTNRTGNADIYVNFCDSNNNVVGDNLDYGDGVVPKNDPSTYGSRSTDIKNHIASGKISYSGASKFMVQFQSAFLSRNYSVYCIFSIDYTVHSHSYTSSVTKEATCTSAGVRTYTCSCGDSYTESIPALGHSWKTPTYTWSSDGKTCTAKRVCNNNSSHTESATATITSAVKTAATCMAKGRTRYTAKFSVSWTTTQTKDVQDIAQKSHSYTGAIKSDGNGKDATHSFKCVNGCNQYGGAVKHTWNSGVITTQPTCTANGVKTYTCTASGCGATYTETIAAKGHSWVAATCTTPKTCSVCGATEGSALGHSYTDVITAPTETSGGYTTHTCSRCGHSYIDSYTYMVRWFNEDGSVELERDSSVPYGEMPDCSVTPTKAATTQHSYEFIGWQIDTITEGTTDLTAVVKSIAYYARFREIVNAYKVTWKNEDGTVLETDEAVPYGTAPDYNGATPTKASTAQYYYTFLGWNTEVDETARDEEDLDAVTGHITYTAVYVPVIRKYRVTIDVENCTVKGNVSDGNHREYGAPLIIEVIPDIGYEFDYIRVVVNNVGTTYKDNPLDDLTVTGDTSIYCYCTRLPIPFKVNLDQATGVYIVPETKEIVIQFDGIRPVIASTDLSVDGWNISVIDYPIDSELSEYAFYEYYPLEKLFISKNNKTTRIW